MAEKITANTLLKSAAFRAGGIRKLKAAIRNAHDAKVVYKGTILGTPAQLFALKADRATKEQIHAVRCMERMTYLGISLKGLDGQELVPTFKNLVKQEVQKLRAEQIKARAEKREYRKQSSYWDRMTKKLISLSSDEVKTSQSYEAAKAEWELHPDREQRLDPWYRRKKGCELCSKDIRWGYVLKNKKTGKEIRVGSECVADNSIPRGEEHRAIYLVALVKQRRSTEESLKRLKTTRNHQAKQFLASQVRDIARTRALLAAMQEMEAEELKASRIREIRAANERYLREKQIPRMQEMLDTLHKYRGILQLIDPMGPTLVTKEIGNLREAMGTIMGMRENAVYFHDSDVHVIKELHKALLVNCPVLAKHQEFEMKMRGLWNHRAASIDGKAVFAHTERSFIEKMHELWRQGITETDINDTQIRIRHFRVPMKEAGTLMALYRRITDKGLLTTEDVLLMDPYFKSKIARLKREIGRFSKEEQALIRKVFNSFGKSTFTYAEIKPILNIEEQARTRSQLKEEEIRSFLMLERRARLEDETRQRFIRNLRDIYERDGLFFKGDILTVLELAKERERRSSKREVRQEINDIDIKVTGLYRWKKMLPKEERYIASIFTDWNDLTMADIAQIDVRRIEELYQELQIPKTLHQLSKSFSGFENLLAIRRGVLKASHMRTAIEMLEPDSVRALQFLAKRNAGDLQRLDMATAEIMLPLFDELRRRFVSSDSVKAQDPTLAAKVHDVLARRWEWGRFIDGKSIERMGVLWNMGYYDPAFTKTVKEAVLDAAEAQQYQEGIGLQYICESHKELAEKVGIALKESNGHVARQDMRDLQSLSFEDWRTQVKFLCLDLKNYSYRQDICDRALKGIEGISRTLHPVEVREVVSLLRMLNKVQDAAARGSISATTDDRQALLDIIKCLASKPPAAVAPKSAGQVARQENTGDQELKELTEFKWGYPTQIQDRKNAVISWREKILNSNDPVLEQNGIEELLKALGDWFYWQKRGIVIWSVHDMAVDAFVAIAHVERLREKVLNAFRTCTEDMSRYGVIKSLERISKNGGELGIKAKDVLDSIELELKERAETASEIDFADTKIEWRTRFENVARWHNIVMATTDRKLAEKGIAEIVKAYQKGEAIGQEAAKSLNLLLLTKWADIVKRYRAVHPEISSD